jgi:SAM-dependent methyltransferase
MQLPRQPTEVHMTSSSQAHAVARPIPHVCPWWLGWSLLFPGRGWFLNPDRLVAPLIEHDCRVLEVGPGNGFVTVSLAERVGPEGRVYCVDLQERMLTALQRRMRRRGLAERISTRVCSKTDLGVSDLAGSIDVAVLIYMLHEVAEPGLVLRQVATTLRSSGKLLLVEPKGHCPAGLFAEQIRLAGEVGLRPAAQQPEYASRLPQALVLERQQ